jgi:hypothetical protein
LAHTPCVHLGEFLAKRAFRRDKKVFPFNMRLIVLSCDELDDGIVSARLYWSKTRDILPRIALFETSDSNILLRSEMISLSTFHETQNLNSFFEF